MKSTHLIVMAVLTSIGPPMGARMLHADAPDNDLCGDAIVVGLGDIQYSTIDAGTDGPELPQSCNEGFGNVFGADIWYSFTPGYTGALRISTCNQADYDTRLAAYEQGCDDLVLVGCNDDGFGCGSYSSDLLILVTVDVPILIRVGGWKGESGTGTLTLEIPLDSDCFMDHAEPGCDDQACSQQVCSIQPSCCDQAWDQECASLALANCDNGGSEGCGDPDGDDCCTVHPAPFCSDEDCCDQVCNTFAECCQVEWDQLCVTIAEQICTTCDDPPPPPPANDDCGDAVLIDSELIPYTLVSATQSPEGSASCTDDFGVDVWFIYEAECNGIATFSTCGATDASRIAVYEGDLCGNLIELGCSEATCSEVQVEVTCGMSYRVKVGGPGDVTGELASSCEGDCAPPCPADFDGNDVVDGADLGVLLSAWGSTGSPADLNDDMLVDGMDLGILLFLWGPCE